EARHKQGIGDDHVSVSWEGPGFSREVIPGRYLAPYYQNYAPEIRDQTFAIRGGAYPNTSIGVVEVTDLNAAESHHSFEITGGTGAGIFGIDADSGRIFVTDTEGLSSGSSFTLKVRARDTGSPVAQGV